MTAMPTEPEVTSATNQFSPILKKLNQTIDLIIILSVRKGQHLVTKTFEPIGRAWKIDMTGLKEERYDLAPLNAASF